MGCLPNSVFFFPATEPFDWPITPKKRELKLGRLFTIAIRMSGWQFLSHFWLIYIGEKGKTLSKRSGIK
jgi:hypothetical protein